MSDSYFQSNIYLQDIFSTFENFILKCIHIQLYHCISLLSLLLKWRSNILNFPWPRTAACHRADVFSNALGPYRPRLPARVLAWPLHLTGMQLYAAHFDSTWLLTTFHVSPRLLFILAKHTYVYVSKFASMEIRFYFWPVNSDPTKLSNRDKLKDVAKDI